MMRTQSLLLITLCLTLWGCHSSRALAHPWRFSRRLTSAARQPQRQPASPRAQGESQCLALPTVPNIQLAAYTGTWYETHVTSRFKLESEAGLVCDKANYSLAPPQPAATPTMGSFTSSGFNQNSGSSSSSSSNTDKDVVTLRVENSGRFVSSPAFLAAVNAIASAQRNSCRVLSAIERELHSSKAALPSLLSSNALQATWRIPDLISQCTAVLLSLAQPSQGSNSSSDSSSISAGTALSSLSQVVAEYVANLTTQQVQEGIVGKKGVKAAGEIASLFSQVAARQKEVQQYFGVLAPASAFNFPQGLGIPISLTGTATADAARVGELTVRFPFQNQNEAGRPNYLILSLTGDARSMYSAALVVSCRVEEPLGPPRFDIYFLSRNKTLPSSTYNAFIKTLLKHGVHPSCDDVIVPSAQAGC